ncbi:hypothetical protein WDZ92_49480, partial [Nostoc sp. NIES-2111]
MEELHKPGYQHAAAATAFVGVCGAPAVIRFQAGSNRTGLRRQARLPPQTPMISAGFPRLRWTGLVIPAEHWSAATRNRERVGMGDGLGGVA